MNKNVVSFLETSYKQHAAKYACVDEREAVSYKELWEDTHVIASCLLNKLDRHIPVAIIRKKSCTTLKLIWGVIKAGGCYVVIDPALPAERIRNILEILEVTWVIGEHEIEDKIPKGMEIYSYESFFNYAQRTDLQCVDERIAQICDIDPLYIMFTSGSTGVPKGIVANHRSLIDFIECFTEIFSINETDIIGNQAPWDFDVSVKDIFSAAKTAATLQIIPKKFFSFPSQLVEFLNETKVTTLIWAVSALCIISSRGLLENKMPETIKKVIFSGEPMPVKQYNMWRKKYPQALFANVYGPTEITCNCTYFLAERFYDENEVIPIGHAFPNEKVFLLDEKNCLIEQCNRGKSEIGEICVSGTAVTMGYYNNKEATALNFVQNPLNNKYLEIIYRTGDLGYYNCDGQLCFMTRKDFQIKHMGHRIELGEIERVIHSIEEVQLCCCVYYEKQIIAFVEGMIEKEKIMKYIRGKLPSYMKPEKIISLQTMPINKNGKIDRKQLLKILKEM